MSTVNLLDIGFVLNIDQAQKLSSRDSLPFLRFQGFLSPIYLLFPLQLVNTYFFNTIYKVVKPHFNRNLPLTKEGPKAIYLFVNAPLLKNLSVIKISLR